MSELTDAAVPDLYRLAFVPGAFRCPACEFVLIKNAVNVKTGRIGTTEQQRESQSCPNDGTMMMHVTYKEQLEWARKRIADMQQTINEHRYRRKAIEREGNLLDIIIIVALLLGMLGMITLTFTAAERINYLQHRVHELEQK